MVTDNTIIRNAKTTDVEKIEAFAGQVLRYCSGYEKSAYLLSPSKKFVPTTLREIVKKKTAVVLVAERDRSVIGYIIGQIKKGICGNIGTIGEMAVKSKKKRATRKKMVKAVVDIFKKRKCLFVDVDVFMGDKQAVKAYESVRFKKRKYSLQLELNK